MLSFYYDLKIPSVSSCVASVYMNPMPQPSPQYWNRFLLRLQYNPWHPQLSPELTQKFPVYTQTSPDGDRAIPWHPLRYTQSTLITHWNTLRNPCQPWGHPDIPWWPSLMARTTPWHSLTVTWWSYILNDIPCWYGNFIFF